MQWSDVLYVRMWLKIREWCSYTVSWVEGCVGMATLQSVDHPLCDGNPGNECYALLVAAYRRCESIGFVDHDRELYSDSS